MYIFLKSLTWFIINDIIRCIISIFCPCCEKRTDLLQHNWNYAVISILTAPYSQSASYVPPPFHTMFVKGVCEIFLKLSNTAANRAFAVAFCVLFRFPLYKYGWFPQMNNQVCQQVLQCLFAMSKMSLQTSV